jgi:hypothetical protein
MQQYHLHKFDATPLHSAKKRGVQNAVMRLLGLEHMGQRRLIIKVTATIQYAYLTLHILFRSGSFIKQTLQNRALF